MYTYMQQTLDISVNDVEKYSPISITEINISSIQDASTRAIESFRAICAAGKQTFNYLSIIS